MKYDRIDFYKNKVTVNLLARDLDNAVAVTEVMEGCCLVGVLSRNFPTAEACAEKVREYLTKLKNVSVGMGDGDPTQAVKAAHTALLTNPGHVNQTFTGAFYTEGLLTAGKCYDTVTNCMIYPTGTPGKVQISTGAVSDRHAKGIVDVETALCMMKDADLPSVKFFNMHGLQYLEDLKAVAAGCAKYGIPMIEPTGGLNVDNVAEIVKVCVDAGVERVMPHVYSSIVDKTTGQTRLDLAQKLFAAIKTVL